MKTYSEMTRSILKRRDEYEASKTKRNKALSAAVLPACILLLSAFAIGAIIIGKTNTPKLPAEEIIQTGTTAETDKIKTPDDKAEFIIIENPTPKSSSGGKMTLSNIYIDAYDIIDDDIIESLSVEKNDKTWYQHDLIGKKHAGICEIGINVKVNDDGSHGKWITYIEADENIEIISPKESIIPYEISETNNNSQTITIAYAYKEGKTNGSISVSVFAGDKNIGFLDKALSKSDDATIEDPKYVCQSKIVVACIKGYDYWGYDLDTIYAKVAIYYGDVDENGIPLFEHDFYMEDYYDCPRCVRGRNDKESYVAERGVLNNASLKNLDIENNNRGIIYDLNISGTIKWTFVDEDNNTSLHNAKFVTIKVYDNDTNALICSTTTNEYGQYNVVYSYNKNGILNLRITAMTYGSGSSVCNSSGSFYEREVDTINGVITSFPYVKSKDFTNSVSGSEQENFNKALSIHQSLCLAKEFASQLTGDNIVNVNVRLSDIFTQYKYNENRIYVLYSDAYDWDVIIHEYGHYFQHLYGIIGIVNGDSSHNYDEDLIYHIDYFSKLQYGKQKAIVLAWNEGWADFFSIYTQVYMNAQNLTIPTVGDKRYSDTREIIVIEGIEYSNDICIDIETFEDIQYPDNEIKKCETNEITVAALLLDMYDPIDYTDYDHIDLGTSTLWSITDDNDCQTLSSFISKVNLSFSNKILLNLGDSLELFHLSARYAISSNLSTNTPTFYWTAPNTYTDPYHYNTYILCFYEKVGTTYNIIGTYGYTSNTSLQLTANEWNTIKSGRSTVYLCVRTFDTYDAYMTGPYYSSSYTINIP